MEGPKPTNFLWINSSGFNAPCDRLNQRREVMQKIAWRRKQQPKKNHPNSIQLPLFLLDGSPETTTGKKYKKISDGPDDLYKDFRVRNKTSGTKNVEPDAFYLSTSLTPPPITAAEHPLIFTKCNLSYLKLSLLASKDVGRYTGQKLLESPKILPRFLGESNQGSYCHYIPFHYDQSDLVRSATDSAVARVRCLLSPENPEWQSLALSSYLKAVSSLQKAIDSPLRLTPEVLLAIQILSLYELLNPHRENAWINHTAGAARIIRLRGPESFVSEFEKCLLMNHVGPIVTESILNNQSCFLEEKSWMKAILGSTTDNPQLPGRGSIVISLLIILISIPSLFRDITDAICEYPPPSHATMLDLMSRARKLRESLQNWHSSNFGSGAALAHKTASCKTYPRRMVLFYICSIYCNRLNTCIYQIGESGIKEMEEESQRFANIMMLLHDEDESSNDESSVLLAQKVPIAEATINSGERWREHLRPSCGHNQLCRIPKQTFKQWCSLFGRATAL